MFEKVNKGAYRIGSVKNGQPMDRLSRDSCAAIAAGMSYGKYKAQNPHTEGPDGIENIPKVRVPKKCEWCRTVIMAKDRRRKYCSVECMCYANKQKSIMREKAKEEQNNGSI